MLETSSALRRKAERNQIATWFSTPEIRAKYPKQMRHFALGKEYTERGLFGGNRTGKAQPVNEPVLTPEGWKPIGALRVGDQVIGSAGTPVTVVAVYPQGERPVFTVECSDGASTRCCAEHLWTVRNTHKGARSEYRTVDTATMRAGGKWMLPPRPEVQYSERTELPIDPYLLGVLIGDGCLRGHTVFVASADDYIVSRCAALAANYGCELKHRSKYDYQFATTERSAGGGWSNLLGRLIEGLGLNVKSALKFIPDEYKTATVPERLELLRGLMDTDGTIDKPSKTGWGGGRTFSTVGRRLAEDFVELARGLGFTATLNAKNGTYKSERHTSWRVQIWNRPVSCFNLPRKKALEKFSGCAERGVTIRSITEAGTAECVCIRVESPDSLYVTRDFILTHNTHCGCYEDVLHLTGRYPDWWEGFRFKKPVEWWAATDTAKNTRDILQDKYCGKIGSIGTGMIPGDTIVRWTPKHGLSDAIETIYVKHVSGGVSELQLKSYDQGRVAFQGTRKDGIHLDEEPPLEVYVECLLRLMSTSPKEPTGLLVLTETPLLGVSDLMMEFMPDLQPEPEAVPEQAWTEQEESDVEIVE
jgi:phage terminase large subunit-like protein